MREGKKINDNELEKVSGGLKYWQLPKGWADCAESGYCPQCNFDRQGEKWDRFQIQATFGYCCLKCGFYAMGYTD